MARFWGEHEGDDYPHKEITRAILVVDDRVVVEAKTVEKLVDANFAQVNSQLRFSGFEVGLLLNFRQWPLKEGIKRVVHTQS
jgi:GxxExxY protein